MERMTTSSRGIAVRVCNCAALFRDWRACAATGRRPLSLCSAADSFWMGDGANNNSIASNEVGGYLDLGSDVSVRPWRGRELHETARPKRVAQNRPVLLLLDAGLLTFSCCVLPSE